MEILVFLIDGLLLATIPQTHTSRYQFVISIPYFEELARATILLNAT